MLEAALREGTFRNAGYRLFRQSLPTDGQNRAGNKQLPAWQNSSCYSYFSFNCSDILPIKWFFTLNRAGTW